MLITLQCPLYWAAWEPDSCRNLHSQEKQLQGKAHEWGWKIETAAQMQAQAVSFKGGQKKYFVCVYIYMCAYKYTSRDLT